MALVVSVIVTSFLYTHIKRQYAMTARPIKIVAAARPLDPGKPLTAEDLTLANWPANVPLSGAASKPESFLGRIVLYPVAAQEPIREQLLAAPGAAVGLTAKIPDGMRAVAIQTNEVNNVSGFLFPGCHVDALVTFRPASGKDSVTMTVLQNVEVLSTGEKLQPDPAGIEYLTSLHYPEDSIDVVLNRCSRKSTVTEQEIEAALHREITVRIPNNYGVVINSINSGIPLELSQKSGLPGAFDAWADRLVGEDAAVEKPTNESRGWLGLFGL
jgi:Flp pilus assembly protein CpaB